MTKTLNLKINYIPFLHIGSPPSNYNLKQAKLAAEKKHGKGERYKTFRQWDVEKVERAALLNSFGSFQTVYVDIGELKRKADRKNKTNYENDIVWTGNPGLVAYGLDKERIKKFSAAPQFAFGGGVYSDKLFLIEDIFEWSHHRISWSEIRTAESIIEDLRKVKTT